MREGKNGPIEGETRASAEGAFLLCSVIIIFGLLMVYLGIHVIKTETVLGGIMPSALGIFICVWGWLLYTDDRAQYDFSSEGVGVKYLLEKRKVIPWEEFKEVCICYTSYTTRGERFAHSVICFVKPGAKYNFYGRWPADNPLHSRKVLSIEYTDEIFEEVQRNCPFTIPDLRKTRRYRL